MKPLDTFINKLDHEVNFEMNNEDFLNMIEIEEFDTALLSLDEINKLIENIENQ